MIVQVDVEPGSVQLWRIVVEDEGKYGEFDGILETIGTISLISDEMRACFTAELSINKLRSPISEYSRHPLNLTCAAKSAIKK